MRSTYCEVTVESLGVNDNNAQVADLVVSEGAHLKQGDLIYLVETTKAIYDVETPNEGYVVPLVEIGDEVSVGQVVAIIVDTKDDVDRAKKTFRDIGDKGVSEEISITKKAKALAKFHNLDLADIASKSGGIIRERDITSILKSNKVKHDLFDERRLIGKLDIKCLENILKDSAFCRLSSKAKIAYYRQHGAEIEEGVEIGDGSVLICEYLHLKKESKIMRECYLKTKSFSLGVMSVIGDRADIVTRHIRIGDVFFSGSNVTIGGGGAFSAQAYLIIGDSCLVSSHCILNTGGGIELGNEVGLSSHVKLYTHNHWQNMLEGYFSNFGPIVIEDNAYITGDSMVVPNVTIGKGATVFANSSVTGDVEPFAQVAGNPAKIVNRIKPQLTPDKKNQIINRLMNDMSKELIESDILNEGDFTYSRTLADVDLTKRKVVLSLNVPEKIPKLPRGVVLFDMERLKVYGEQGLESDEVRNFLRRRGIRFSPIYWRYDRDKGLYND
jgi:acyl-[acyl carrier protein]--UDP-N-acetylglucosamine O-acyltransferase